MEFGLSTLRRRYLALATRERALVVATLAAGMCLLWDLAFYSWAASVVTKLSREVHLATQNIAAEIQKQGVLNNSRGGERLARLTSEKERLSLEIEAIEARYSALLGEFVDPERMPAVLGDVLQQNDELELVSLASLPSRPIEVGAARERVEGIYLHPLELTFEGSFFAVLDYLEALESLEWDFVWRSIRYDVIEHPKASVVLTLETIGREEDWLGV